jgi:hypothetical protein
MWENTYKMLDNQEDQKIVKSKQKARHEQERKSPIFETLQM